MSLRTFRSRYNTFIFSATLVKNGKNVHVWKRSKSFKVKVNLFVTGYTFSWKKSHCLFHLTTFLISGRLVSIWCYDFEIAFWISITYLWQGLLHTIRLLQVLQLSFVNFRCICDVADWNRLNDFNKNDSKWLSVFFLESIKSYSIHGTKRRKDSQLRSRYPKHQVFVIIRKNVFYFTSTKNTCVNKVHEINNLPQLIADLKV